ncbi:MAG: hypothetical protein IJ837_00920 [Clostridia bacterium]|nr:hypothetical protein [Clostridia bacterium]
MQIELDNFIIHTDKDLDYLSEISKTLNSETKKVLDFFELKELKEKKNVVIYTDIQKYKAHKEEMGEDYQEWMCGDTMDGNINLLELTEAQKTKAHKNMTLKDFLQSVIHEFVHACQQEVNNDFKGLVWFWEALATNLSGQQDNCAEIKNCDFEKLKTDFNTVRGAYGYAYLLGDYMLKTYGQKKVLDYVKNPNKLRQDEDKIFNSAKNSQKREVNNF